MADRIGARNCLRAGAVVMTAANLAPVLAPSYTGFLVHFLAIAAGRSLTSGAASAYLYDGLRAEGADEHYLKAEGTGTRPGSRREGAVLAAGRPVDGRRPRRSVRAERRQRGGLPGLRRGAAPARAARPGHRSGAGQGRREGSREGPGPRCPAARCGRRAALRTGLALARPGDGAGRGGLHALPHLPGQPLPARTARPRHRRELARRGAGRHDRGGGGGLGPSPVARPASVAGHLGVPAQPRAGGHPRRHHPRRPLDRRGPALRVRRDHRLRLSRSSASW